jgi:hypothetical protein
MHSSSGHWMHLDCTRTNLYAMADVDTYSDASSHPDTSGCDGTDSYSNTSAAAPYTKGIRPDESQTSRNAC